MTQKFAIGTRVMAETVNHGYTDELPGVVQEFDPETGEYRVMLERPITRFGGKVQCFTYEEHELRVAQPWD